MKSTCNRLVTARLELVEVSPSVAGLLARGESPAEQVWADGYPLDGTLVAAAMLLRGVASGADGPGFGMYQLVDRETVRVLGDVGFHGPPDDSGDVEIGYGIAAPRRGQGLATEAVRALVGWALAQPGVRRVVAGTDPDDAVSQRVLVRAGFVDR